MEAVIDFWIQYEITIWCKNLYYYHGPGMLISYSLFSYFVVDNSACCFVLPGKTGISMDIVGR